MDYLLFIHLFNSVLPRKLELNKTLKLTETQ